MTGIHRGTNAFLTKMAAKKFFHDPEGILIESMDFDNPEVYGDTSIFDGLVFQVIDHLKQIANSKSLQKV